MTLEVCGDAIVVDERVVDIEEEDGARGSVGVIHGISSGAIIDYRTIMQKLAAFVSSFVGQFLQTVCRGVRLDSRGFPKFNATWGPEIRDSARGLFRFPLCSKKTLLNP